MATLRIAVDLVDEGPISSDEAILKLEGIDLNSISVQRIRTDKTSLAKGDSASGGVAIGKITFSSERAKSHASGENVILVREIPSPDDLPEIQASTGLLTSSGARTAHSAIIARQMGKVCIVNWLGAQT
jgi:pyruvate, orthophosphate dikinase